MGRRQPSLPTRRPPPGRLPLRWPSRHRPRPLWMTAAMRPRRAGPATAAKGSGIPAAMTRTKALRKAATMTTRTLLGKVLARAQLGPQAAAPLGQALSGPTAAWLVRTGAWDPAADPASPAGPAGPGLARVVRSWAAAAQRQLQVAAQLAARRTSARPAKLALPPWSGGALHPRRPRPRPRQRLCLRHLLRSRSRRPRRPCPPAMRRSHRRASGRRTRRRPRS
mmetsp:Transcript_10277/g.30127  ORF Transcript_10277/g.30127 Transcript_10277/m.30127 type:complete len:223 (+) Transcript_10277:130-798(+)